MTPFENQEATSTAESAAVIPWGTREFGARALLRAVVFTGIHNC
jgi:hypothetical protein